MAAKRKKRTTKRRKKALKSKRRSTVARRIVRNPGFPRRRRRIVRNPGFPRRRRKTSRAKQTSVAKMVLLSLASIATSLAVTFGANRIPNKKASVGLHFLLGIPALIFGVKKKNPFFIGLGVGLPLLGTKTLLTQAAPNVAGEPSPDDIQAFMDYQEAELMGEAFEVTPGKYLNSQNAYEVDEELNGAPIEMDGAPFQMAGATFNMDGDGFSDYGMEDGEI